MQVILASDAKADKAAAALCMGVGRIHEPKDMPGLAHFCEHMLFLGTEAFPNEAEYKQFVKRNGGSCNAATGDTYTYYVFDIAPAFLSGALDRFSQFFRTPLFTPAATERELNAVDSEHSMRITDDGRRAYASLLLDANPAHPLHWGSGNAHSLRDAPRARGADPHSEVVNFWKTNYTAEDMTLAVVGRESLPELRRLVEERFSDVRVTGKRALRGDAHGGDEPPIKPSDFAGLVLRVPSKDKRTVSFSWQLPTWQVPLWRTKPGNYAQHILGHEGEGSLLSVLKSKGYATSLGAGVDEFGVFSQFDVELNATEKGLDHVEDIGALVFSYIRLLSATPVQSWVLEEMQQLSEIKFRFSADQQPYDLVSRIVKSLQNYPPESIFSAAKLPETDAKASAEILTHLGVEGVRVQLTAKRFAERCTTKDPWYGGQLLRLPLDESWKQTWAEAAGLTTSPPGADRSAEREVAEAAAASHGLKLPRPNVFIPSDLSLRPLADGANPAQPRELTAGLQGLARVFHRHDDRFGQPKSVVAFRIHSPEVARDAASHLRARVWCSCIMEELNEETYDAYTAGLAFSVSSVPSGLEMVVSGFSDKLPVLLDVVTRKMRDTKSVQPGSFAIVRDRYERSLKNVMLKQRPCDLASRMSRQARYSLSFPLEDQFEELSKLTAADLDGENGRILGESRVEAFLLGNMDAQDAAGVAARASNALFARNEEPARLPLRAEAGFPPGHTLWRIDGTNPEERNNNVRLEIQMPISTDNLTYTSLLVRVLSPSFFEELRTQQQLGYIVQMSWAENEGFISINCTVQTEYPPDYVRQRVDTFFNQRLQWAQEHLDEEEFARQRSGLISNLAEEPKNLNEEFRQHWGEIAQRLYNFDRRSKRIKELESADLATFLGFLRTTLLDAPRLYVQVQSIAPGEAKKLPADAEEPREPDRVWSSADDVLEFRARATWVELGSDEIPASRL